MGFRYRKGGDMALCSDTTALVGIVLVLMLVLSSFLAGRAFRGRKAASSPVQPGSMWKLGFVAGTGKKYRLCFSYQVAFNGGEDDFGLVADYHCQAAGLAVSGERAGIGSVQPPERERTVRMQHNCSFSSTLDRCRQRAVFVLTTLGPFDNDTHVTAEGTIEVNPGTVLEKGEVFFS